jgi:replicative DNA helicase
MSQDSGLSTTLLRLSDKLSEYLSLKGITIAADGFHRCINPSHEDRHPSSSIGGKEEFSGKVTHCFSCGGSYSIFHAAHFLDNKPMSGPDFFQDTLPFLSKLFDVPYEPIKVSEDAKREYQKRRAYEDAVNAIHSGIFIKDSSGKMVLNIEHPAIKHLCERGITEETIRKFKIGCINRYDSYIKNLQNLGWDDRTYLEAADLANTKLFNSIGIIIPIFDEKSRPVGFVTRRTDMKENEKGQEKYVNSQNSDIYHKSKILFNFNNYEDDAGPLIIVEGYLDAVYLTQAGIKNVAAIGATVLTEEHVDLLFTKKIRNIVICLDADEGGDRGVKLAIERLSVYKTFNVKIIELPKGNDPDNFVRNNNVDKFLELIRSEAALSPFAWMIKHTTFEDDPMETAQKAIPTIAAEESNIVRMKMIRELSRLTSIEEADIRKDVDSLINKESNKFLEELSEINNFVQVQLSRKKIKDTKSIIEDSMIKIKNLERQFLTVIDNKTEYTNKIDEIKSKIESGKFTYGIMPHRFKKLYEEFDGIPYGTCLTLFGGRPSAGKCHTKDTPILMYDGSVKLVQDIIIGDKIMGPDSNPRTVLRLGKGKDDLYMVYPRTGNPYGVNSEHILCLKRSKNGKGKNPKTKHGDEIEISVKDFIKKPLKFKNNFKGFKVPVEFKNNNSIKVDPYFVGLWLGNGDTKRTIISNEDPEVISYLKDYGASFGINVINKEKREGFCKRWWLNKGEIHERMIQDEYINTKKIKESYLITSKENRLKLLAGLLDSDGFLAKKDKYFEITLVNEKLIDQIKFLCDTLGFKVNKSKKLTHIKKINYTGIAFRLLIKGDLTQIPTKIKRKIAKRKPIRDPSIVGIKKVKHLGIGDYFGFELDGDKRYLLGDCTVTHNTALMTSLLMDIVDSDDEACVFYMSIDDTTELMTLKMLAVRSGLSTSQIKNYTRLSPEEKEQVDAAWRWIELHSDRFIMADATAGNTYEALEAHTDWFVKNTDTKKRILALDNFHKLRSSSFGRGGKKSEAVADQSEKIKELTQLNDLHLMATVELRKLEGTDSRPTLGDLKDSVQLEYDADVIILVHNDMQVNDKSLYKYQGLANGVTEAMPYIDVKVGKNKVTGRCDRFFYELNSWNLQIKEANSQEIKRIEADARKKTNNDNRLGSRM